MYPIKKNPTYLKPPPHLFCVRIKIDEGISIGEEGKRGRGGAAMIYSSTLVRHFEKKKANAITNYEPSRHYAVLSI